MSELLLDAPSESEVDDALEGLADVLRLCELGEIDLPPYLTTLLLQLEEALSGMPVRAVATT